MLQCVFMEERRGGLQRALESTLKLVMITSGCSPYLGSFARGMNIYSIEV